MADSRHVIKGKTTNFRPTYDTMKLNTRCPVQPTKGVEYNAVARVSALRSLCLRRYLPGFYNSSCGPYGATCLIQLYLQCVGGRCICFDNYIPNGSGGCKDDWMQQLVTWTVRFLISATVFFLCLALLHMMVSKRFCGRARADEVHVEADDRNTNWYDDPPPYQEATEDGPPPTYQEAVAKEKVTGQAQDLTHIGRPESRSPASAPSLVSPAAHAAAHTVLHI